MKIANEKIGAEINCIAGAVDTIEKLRKGILSESDGYDSVAEAQANEATVRVLNYLISFYGFQVKP